MKKLFMLLSLFVLIISPYNVFADEEDVRDLPTRERIFVGGYIGLQIGTVTAIVVSPTIAYRFTNRLTMGLGGTYQYYRDRGWGISPEFSSSTNIFGGSAFARYSITPQFFGHIEYEALNLDSQMGFSLDSTNEDRFWEHNFFAGGGYRAPLSPRAFLNLMVLYNFNSESVVYYQNPILRIGLDVRL
ncbi:MAG: hypothetical protein EA393_03950 [Bacteroidetes bacterium]|nr:MAG: hypothetical protein EA393_03950 [Bacteroidota bacterium]